MSVQTNFSRLETASRCDIVHECSANIYGPNPLSNAVTYTYYYYYYYCSVLIVSTHFTYSCLATIIFAVAYERKI